MDELHGADQYDGSQRRRQDPDQRLQAHGVKFCPWRENVAEYYSTPNVASLNEAIGFAMNFWKNSPGYRANMLAADVNLIGVGVTGWTHGDRNYYKFAQFFINDCRPAGHPVALGKRKIPQP